MRNILLMCLLLTGCATQMDAPEKRTHDFYTFYLTAFVTDSLEDDLDSSKMREYIARDTLSRLKKILSLYEQEIIDSDYFTYTQDYAAEWIPDLSVSNAINYASGKVVNVELGAGNSQKLRLKVYLRNEDGKWKIYRVADASHRFEQNIFDDRAIAAAQRYAASITSP
ncbi:YbjP/YqhG family protein [Enterobacter cloacae complex sp. ECC445]|uniref:YbjP/YqhG family protein n=1 Tax=Enterobacter cloacae complex sp. ECC445 TaxID=2913213 RepID=UPI001F1AAB69|nr:YbjP/YqhG family protein [Enterobacter cloacae complex sp. ECC445]MCG0455166.1 YbjP/YqhG family protein [Enterobacter cloacae complex sp. ECC445]